MASEAWRHEVLPDWHQARAARKTLLLWWEGIPSEVRGLVWARALGVSRERAQPVPSSPHASAHTALRLRFAASDSGSRASLGLA